MAAVTSFERAPYQPRLHHRPLDLGAANRLANGGPSKQLEREGAGGGIAGQAQQGRLAEQARGQRLARLQPHPPEVDIALLRQNLLDEVIVADRDTTRGQDEVGGSRLIELRADLIGAVARNAEPDWLPSGAQYRRNQVG